MWKLALVLIVALSGQPVLAAQQPSGPQPDESLDPFRQKAILITGATSGIGRNIAEKLAAAGHFVYAGARKQDDIDELNRIQNVQAVRLDVTNPGDIEKAVTFVRDQGRGLYGLINNAGVTVFGPMIEVSEEDLQFQLDVNLFGPYRVTRAFAPLIIENQGRIVNTGSMAGLFGAALMGPYNMSKFALEGYSEALAQELQKFNVTVSVIEPGNFNSNIIRAMTRRMADRPEVSGSLYAEESRRLYTYFAEGRTNLKEPDEVAAAMMDALFSPDPQLRYLVAPNAKEAGAAIRQEIRRLLQINFGQPYAYDKDELIHMLGAEIDDYFSDRTRT